MARGLLCILICCIILGCQAEGHFTLPDGVTAAETDHSPSIAEKVLGKQQNDSRFDGCWSNARGETLLIENPRMVYGYVKKDLASSPRPVTFVLEESFEGDGILVKLLDRPPFFIFQNYVTLRYLEFNSSDPVEISEQSYASYEDFTNDVKSGYGKWVKGRCKGIYPKWYLKYYGFRH